jgi:hypothetical protein
MELYRAHGLWLLGKEIKNNCAALEKVLYNVLTAIRCLNVEKDLS